MKEKLYELRLPIILILEIVLVFLFGDFIPEKITSLFYAISLNLKDALLMVLPLIIFTFIVHSMCELKEGALSFIILAFLMVLCSNFISTMLSGTLGEISLSYLDQKIFVASQVDELLPMWEIHFPKLVTNEGALISGLMIGFTLSLFRKLKVKAYINYLYSFAVWFLKRIFVPIIPIFIFGFLLKMSYDGVLEVIIQDYISIFLIVSILLLTYIILLYGIATRFNPTNWFNALRNMLPATITGFSSMSSASALLLIISGVEKNTKHYYGSSVVPITVNIHMIGDCFSIPIFATAILLSFGMPLPTMETYLLFTVFFVLTRFAVAAVPGGGIFITLPILEKYFGFNGEMLSLITAIYILFDPITTATNVLGNGAFAMHFSKVYQFFMFKSPKEKIS